MTRPDYVIVGPDPRAKVVANPGGQLTATTGLFKYANEVGVELAFVDTLQGSFPPPPVIVRIMKALRRQVQFLWYATIKRPKHGAIIFSAGPSSFIERGVIGLIARVLRVPAVTCLRSGTLMPFLGARSVAGRIISTLVRLQPRILVQGRSWLTYLDRAGVDRTRVHVVANWVSPEKLIAEAPRAARAGEPIRFIFVGWLVVEKGLRELLQACLSLVEAGDAFKVMIVGGGTLHDELSAQIKSLELSHVITMAGWVEPKEVVCYMEKADVFVLPTYSEGFPNTLIEAFAVGLPAIATAVGAIPDSLEDQRNGFLITPRDHKSLAFAMRRYIHNQDLVSRHSLEAIETVRQKHDFKTNCGKILAVVSGKSKKRKC